MGGAEVKREIEEQLEGAPIPPEKVEELKRGLTPANPNSVLYFGVEAQQKLEQVSEEILKGVQNRQLGEVGKELQQLVLNLKGLKLEEIEPHPAWWERLLGLKRSIQQLFEEYQQVQHQIEEIVQRLERGRLELERDLIRLEHLYTGTLEYLKELELYIKAGEERLEELNREIERKQQQVEEGGVLEAQQLRDLIEFRNSLERRLHDLKLTRQVVLQSLANIRLIEENDKILINKITSTILNTIPLWKNRLAQVVAVARGRGVAADLREASNFTNRLLEEGARELKEATREIREEGERGIVELESLKKANQQLIEAITLSVELAEKGRARRKAVEGELAQLEEQLKERLAQVRDRRLGLSGGETPGATSDKRGGNG